MEDFRNLLSIELRYEQDLVIVRQKTRLIAEGLGFDIQDQTRIVTALSEVTRNALQYALGGKIVFGIFFSPHLRLVISVEDRGQGIPNVNEILTGNYLSRTGLGLGLVGAKRLMDQFEIFSTPGQGTRVVLSKSLPHSHSKFNMKSVIHVLDKVSLAPPQSLFEELRRQNQELLSTMEKLRLEQVETKRLNHELSQTNRELKQTNQGLLALHAELDEKANSLQSANEVKIRFLSNVSHEFRTPLNSITGLSRMLLEQEDGPLHPEQVKQAQFICKSAQDLSLLVNDLLDLGKVESGKETIHPHLFLLRDLFDALQGMFRPLVSQSGVRLIFEPSTNDSLLPYSDENKIAQILRNLIMNALKFTETGEIRVSATRALSTTLPIMIFKVTDTGIGINSEYLEKIFDPYCQIDSPLQRRQKGTGLGLPLCKKLAQLLGGDVTVCSTPGSGSTFTVSIPLSYSEFFFGTNARFDIVPDSDPVRQKDGLLHE